jgi:hypothetical protein
MDGYSEVHSTEEELEPDELREYLTPYLSIRATLALGEYLRQAGDEKVSVADFWEYVRTWGNSF